LALSTDLVDKPGNHKTHHIPTPYLGGVAVLVSVLVAFSFDFRMSPGAAAIAFNAAILGTIGLIDDDRTVHPGHRFAAQFAAAVAAVALGLRIHATGVTAIDIALTILWIVGVTNAFNLLDNMDGLTAGVAAMAATAVFWLAILGQQPVLATLAAALVGSCVGFLAYNRPPASIFLGDAGSLFVGFVVAILTIDVTPALAPPFGFLIPLVILALPVLDTTTVVLSRLRRRRSVALGGRDHLSHRLVARGLSRKHVVLFLVAVEAVLGTLAVLGGRRVIQVRWTLVGALAVLTLVTLITSRADVYDEPAVGFPRSLKLALGALLVVTPLISLPALMAVVQAASPARTGEAAARRALDAMASSDATRTASEFDLAAREFGHAEAELRGPLVTLGLVVPGVATNLQASRTLASVGRRLSESGARVARISDSSGLQVKDGSVSLEEVRAAAVELSSTVSALRTSQQRLAAVDRPFLVPPLQRALRQLDQGIERQADTVERASQTAELVPAFLGEADTRHYFLAFQDSSRARGTGGVIGSWAELVAQNGRLTGARYGTLQELNEVNAKSRVLHMPAEFTRRWADFQPAQHWEQVNVSPDFPTAAKVISDLYPQSGGQPVDGVIAVDAMGLSELLELAGPVTVPSWAGPIGAANVVDVVLKESHEQFPEAETTERSRFLRDLLQGTVKALTTAELGTPTRIAPAFSRAAASGHLMAHLTRTSEQRSVERLEADGAVEPVAGDSLMAVIQASDNQLGSHLQRRLRYDVSLDPDSRPARLSGRVQITLGNELPKRALGDRDTRQGDDSAHLSIYTPFAGRSGTLDGRPYEFNSAPDLGRQAHWMTLPVPPSSSRTVTIDLDGQVRLSPEGWYRLDLPQQRTGEPDAIEISLAVPRDWRIVETRGGHNVDDQRAEAALTVDRSHTVWVRVERASAWARLWDRLRDR